MKVLWGCSDTEASSKGSVSLESTHTVKFSNGLQYCISTSGLENVAIQRCAAPLGAFCVVQAQFWWFVVHFISFSLTKIFKEALFILCNVEHSSCKKRA